MSSWYFDGYISKLRIVQTVVGSGGKPDEHEIEIEIKPSEEFRHTESSKSQSTEAILLVGECKDNDVTSAKLIPIGTKFVFGKGALKDSLNASALVLLKVQHVKVRFYLSSDRISPDGTIVSGCELL